MDLQRIPETVGSGDERTHQRDTAVELERKQVTTCSNDELTHPKSGQQLVPINTVDSSPSFPLPAATPSSPAVLGLAYVLLSSFLFSIMALCVNYLGDEVHALQQAAMRYAVSTIASVAGVACARRGKLTTMETWLGKPEHRRLLVARAVWGMGGMIAYFYGLTVLALGDAASITFMSVPATAIVARVLLKEPYTWVDAVCAILCMAGVVLIAQPTAIFGGSAVGTVPWLPIVTTLFGAATAAMAFVTVRQLKGADALVITLYFSAVGAILSPLLLPVFSVTPVMPSLTAIALLTVVGLAGCAGQVLLNRGIQLAPAGPATAMRYADIIFALIFQATLLHAPPAPVKVVGAMLIMSCVAGIIVRSRRAQQQAVGGSTVVSTQDPLSEHNESIATVADISAAVASEGLGTPEATQIQQLVGAEAVPVPIGPLPLVQADAQSQAEAGHIADHVITHKSDEGQRLLGKA